MNYYRVTQAWVECRGGMMSFIWPGKAHNRLGLGLHPQVAPAAGDTISFKARKKSLEKTFSGCLNHNFFLQEMCQSPALPVTLRGAGAAWHWVCRPCLPACCPQQSIVSPQTLFGAVDGADGIAQGLEATISLSSFLHCQRLLQRQTSSCEMQL